MLSWSCCDVVVGCSTTWALRHAMQLSSSSAHVGACMIEELLCREFKSTDTALLMPVKRVMSAVRRAALHVHRCSQATMH